MPACWVVACPKEADRNRVPSGASTSLGSLPRSAFEQAHRFARESRRVELACGGGKGRTGRRWPASPWGWRPKRPPQRDRPAGLATTVGVPMKGTLSQKKAIKLLQDNGWTKSRGGKHQVKMTKPGQRPITLPQHKGRDYPPGLASAILKQAGLQ